MIIRNREDYKRLCDEFHKARKTAQMFKNAPLPSPKSNGKPNTNKDYQSQGWNAAIAGIPESDCPYYATSTAEKYWLKGHREY